MLDNIIFVCGQAEGNALGNIIPGFGQARPRGSGILLLSTWKPRCNGSDYKMKGVAELGKACMIILFMDAAGPTLLGQEY